MHSIKTLFVIAHQLHLNYPVGHDLFSISCIVFWTLILLAQTGSCQRAIIANSDIM